MAELTFNLWSFLGGLLSGGIGGALLTISLKKSMRSKGGGNTVDQAGASAAGDIVGRDKRV